MQDRGVVYLAFGANYHAECRRSLTSLRKVSPNVAVAVVTDEGWSEEPRPDRFVLRPRVDGFHCKPVYIYEASPFAESIFIDTDTVIARDIEPLFGLLRHYDIGVRFGGPQLNHGDGLELHTSCSSGVVLFKKSPPVEAVFREWLALYQEAAAALAAGDRRGLADQRYLAIALALSTARPVHLAEYLNFGVFETITTSSPPFVYHGRAPWIEKVAAWMNRSWTDNVSDYRTRLWMPNISGFLPMGVRHSDPLLALALVLRRAWNELRWRMSRPS